MQRKLEHYEIAAYSCLRDWATVLNNHEAVFFLEEILDQEQSADHKLSEQARSANVQAAGSVKGAAPR